ncbi:MAG: FAD-dependent oxidoreductase [Opitutaceae bacterium]
MNHKLGADVAILGGGVGGCAAALALAEAGKQVILTEETVWIGGQLTSQAVPPDEHGWIEHQGCTFSYRRFRATVRNYYRKNYPLLPHYRCADHLNPGNGWVSPLCHEPRVALASLEMMLAPHVSAGRVRILRKHRLAGVHLRDAAHLAAVVVSDARQVETAITADYFLDATENGDLLPYAGAEYVTGAESRAQTGEANAPEHAAPGNNQAFSLCFALEHRAGENHVIPPPADWGYWKDYRPALRPPWPGPLLSWNAVNPRTLAPIRYRFDPHNEAPIPFSGLWSYRRILDRSLFVPGAYASDVTLVNWPMIDYMEGDLLTTSEETRAVHLNAARQLSLSMVYWLQTEAPRPDGGLGWPGLRLRGDLLGSGDGLALAPYIRESRRIRAERTIVERDLSAAFRSGDTLAERYNDTVGVGYYRIDLHPSSGGDNYIDVASLPFRIPLGALIPVRMENLLPAAKNIGVTHITNGCYRLHPVEWNVGEAAGTLCAYALDHSVRPRVVLHNDRHLAAFQAALECRGVQLRWPENLNLEDGDSHIHARGSS